MPARPVRRSTSTPKSRSRDMARQYVFVGNWGAQAIQETGQRAVTLDGVLVQETTSAGGVAYTLTITPSAVPIGGSVVAPLLAFAETITPSAVPIGGTAVVPFSTIAYAPT